VGGTSIGVEAEPIAQRRSGTTTFIDAGTAGPANFPGFRRHVIEPSPVRILAYLNVSFAGIFAFSRTVMVGESSDLRLLDLNGMRARRPRKSRSDRRREGASARGARRVERRCASRHGARSRRRAQSARDGAHRSSAAHAQGVLERLRPGTS
jgi:hypothetical protein